MRNPFVHEVGGVVSADIAVPNHEAELAFYSSILTTGKPPLWRSDLSNNEGTPVIGLGIRTPEYENLPLQWIPHFQVADVSTSVSMALELGGTELMHGKSDDGRSLWAGLTDQFGAAFGMIPVVEGASPVAADIGRISCLSLNVEDASASQNFYKNVIGWNARPSERLNPRGDRQCFQMQLGSGNVAAEINQTIDLETNIPAVWLIHLPVGDLPESLRRVNKGSGEVVKILEEDQTAIIRDPVGVFVALHAVS